MASDNPLLKNMSTAPSIKQTPNKSSTSKPSTGGNATHKARAEAVMSLGQLGQVPLIALKQYADAGAISLHWPKISEEIATLAETQPAIANLIDPLLQVGPYAALVTAVLPFILQIGVNHNRIQPGAMGTVPGSSLSAQIETAIAQAEAEALKLQLDAEKSSNAIRAEITKQREEMQQMAAVA